jgi:hypothetical protein
MRGRGAVTAGRPLSFNTYMLVDWLRHLESLEAISQDADTRRLLLLMATLSETGRLEPFLSELQHDAEIDDETRGTINVIAEDESFLLVVQEYLRRTQLLH